MTPEWLLETGFDRAWLALVTAFGLIAARRFLESLLPKDHHFRFMERWLARNDDKKHETSNDPDHPDNDKWMGAGG